MDKKTANQFQYSYQTKDTSNHIEIVSISTAIQNKLILNDVSFNVKKGSFHGFIGPNGAGKTTCIKAILSAVPISKGTICINRNGVEKNNVISSLGYIPESLKFDKAARLIRQIKNYCILHDINLNLVNREIEVFSNDVYDLKSLLNKKIKSLSSGQQKLVLLFLLSFHKPKILILDEPMENLDPTHRLYFYKKFKKMSNDGVTIFISSHVLEELQTHCDDITMIDYGKIIYTGPAETDDKIKVIAIQTKEKLSNKKWKEILGNYKILHNDEEIVRVEVPKSIDNEKLIKKMLDSGVSFYGISQTATQLSDLYNELIVKNKTKKVESGNFKTNLWTYVKDFFN